MFILSNSWFIDLTLESRQHSKQNFDRFSLFYRAHVMTNRLTQTHSQTDHAKYRHIAIARKPASMQLVYVNAMRSKNGTFSVNGCHRQGETSRRAGHVVSSHLYPVSLDVVGAVGASGKVGQVELDLVPAGVEAHRQHAAERVDARRALVVARAEPTSDVLVVQDLRDGTVRQRHATDDGGLQNHKSNTRTPLATDRPRNRARQ